MSRVYLLNYNNYGNRIIKRESSLANYLLADPTYKMYSDINFYRNDGVNTRQTINIAAAESEKNADYLIVTDNSGNIVSRWFIIECNFNRKNQMILTLRRDLIVDFLDDIKSQPFYCEKGVVPFSTGLRSIICQPEPAMQFNQVLTKKTNIVSGTANGIFGYIDRTYSGNKIAADVNTIYVNSFQELPIYNVIGLTVWHTSSPTSQGVYAMIKDSTLSGAKPGHMYMSAFNEAGTGTTTTAYYNAHSYTSMISPWGSDDTAANTNTKFKNACNSIATALHKDIEKESTDADYENVQQYVGKPIMVGERLYRISLEAVGGAASTRYITMSKGNYEALCAAMQQEGITMVDYAAYDGTTNELFLGVYGRYYNVILKEDTETAAFALQGPQTRTHCGKPYDIFYMAWSTQAQQIASIIAARLYSSGACYDVQRLPYRAPAAIQGTSQAITYGGVNVTLYWLNIDEFSLTSTSSETEWNSSAYNSTEKAKIGACCDTLRIVSPNRANSWDFNPAQTGGVDGWYIRCTMKPFQPYIHIRPYLNGLYNGTGDSNQAYANDPRGLVCGGSFSFPLVSDKWANYQINNFAYFNAFERDIQNMSTVQDAQRTLQKWQIAAGTVSAATMGAYAGSNIGGTTGAIAGGVAGGIGSLIAGIADYEINEKLRNEAIDYKRDQFGFSLQNLVAAPRALARTDAFDIDWNGFPYVEYYTATAAEKEMLKRKIRYNGMSLNALSDPAGSTYITGGLITLLSNANGSTISTYVKGKLIRFGGKDDTHVFNEIANELYKGIYWQGGTVT